MNIEEAEGTYFSSVIEYAESCSEHEKDNALIDFNINKANYSETSISLYDLNKYLKIHTSEYDLEDGSEKSFENQKYSSIIIVHDSKTKKYLIIDGNHRVNTFSKKYPNWEMNTVTISARIFKNMGK